jgi:hypothetical protein
LLFESSTTLDETSTEIVLFSVCIDCFLCVAEASAKIRCGIVVFTDLGIQTQQHLMNEEPKVGQMLYFLVFSTAIE